MIKFLIYRGCYSFQVELLADWIFFSAVEPQLLPYAFIRTCNTYKSY